MFSNITQKRQINTTLEALYSNTNTIDLFSEKLTSSPKTNYFQPIAFKNLDDQWIEIVFWFLKESEYKSEDLWNHFLIFLQKAHTETSSELITQHLEGWLNSLKPLLKHKYHLGNNLNKYYHSNQYSINSRVIIINFFRDFINQYNLKFRTKEITA